MIIESIIYAEKKEPDQEGTASTDYCVPSLIRIINVIMIMIISNIIYARERKAGSRRHSIC